MKKIIKIIYYIFLTGLILLATLLILTTFSIPGFDLDARIVGSGSMEPELPTGSLVFILSDREYTEGDIITYRIEGMELPTTHRVVKVTKEENGATFMTKGDANRSNDAWLVKQEDVLGSVRFHVPFLGYVINFARQPIGLFILILIPAIIITADEVKKIIKEVKKKKENNR